MKPMPAQPGMICEPHRDRAHVLIPAQYLIGGTPMCKKCFRGRTPLAGQKCLTQRLQERRIRDAQAFARLSIAAHVPGPNPSQQPRNKGQIALAIAKLHPQHSIGGTGNRDAGLSQADGRVSRETLRRARLVLRHRDLAAQVASGELPLPKAYFLALKRREKREPHVEPYVHIEGTKSQRAMALAMRFPGGGWGTDGGARNLLRSGGFDYGLLKQARRVLRRSRELGDAVRRGELSVGEADKRLRRSTSPIFVDSVLTQERSLRHAQSLPL